MDTDTITLGGGCFWCTEAIFLNIKGVMRVESGYSGGKIANPTYREVSSGMTSHAEVIQIVFDPEMLKTEDLLRVFFGTHDPTTMNRQGADVGSQYRSVIFYRNDAQKKAAEMIRKEAQGYVDDPVVTEIEPFTAFYKAEDYHQNYYYENQNKPYCSAVIAPKLKKLQEKYKDLIK